MGGGGTEIVEENADFYVFGTFSEGVGVSDCDVVVTKNVNLDVDVLLRGCGLPFEFPEEFPAVDQPFQGPAFWFRELVPIEQTFKGSTARRVREGLDGKGIKRKVSRNDLAGPVPEHCEALAGGGNGLADGRKRRRAESGCRQFHPGGRRVNCLDPRLRVVAGNGRDAATG